MQIFPVEYSSLSSKSLLNLIEKSYGLAPNFSITFLKRGFNDTYLISLNENLSNDDVSLTGFSNDCVRNRADNQKFILRIYKYNWRSFESIETEVKLLNHLNENEVSVLLKTIFPAFDIPSEKHS
jgi:hypothetical protein